MKTSLRLGAAVLAGAALCGLWPYDAAAAVIFGAVARAGGAGMQDQVISSDQPTPQSVVAGPVGNANSNSVSTARALPGALGVTFDNQVSQPDPRNPAGNAGASATANIRFDDLTISPINGTNAGLSDPVLVEGVNFSFEGRLGAGVDTAIVLIPKVTVSITGTGFGSMVGTTTLQVNGGTNVAAVLQTGVLDGKGSLAGSAENASWTVNTDLTSEPFNATPGKPLRITMSLAVNGNAGVAARNVGTGFSRADFDNTLSLAASGPVLNLPAGFTANSAQANIVDNRWLGVPGPIASVSEPDTWAIFTLGLAAMGVAGWRRRR